MVEASQVQLEEPQVPLLLMDRFVDRQMQQQGVEIGFTRDGSPFRLKLILELGLKDATSSPQRSPSERLIMQPNGQQPWPLQGPGKWFSPNEQAIWDATSDQWQTKQEIADKCNLPVESRFCCLLTNLVDRQVLESSHRGYRRKR